MKRVLPEVTPGCEWVLAGEGTATRKYDGTCVMWDPGRNLWLSRREVKPDKTPPLGWFEVDRDEITGKRTGWEPAEQGAFVKQLREAIDNTLDFGQEIPSGTYELCGPDINGNPEHLDEHRLFLLKWADRYPAMNRPMGYTELATVMATLPWEGLVWHHPDGRMCKLKRRDFPGG